MLFCINLTLSEIKILNSPSQYIVQAIVLFFSSLEYSGVTTAPAEPEMGGFGGLRGLSPLGEKNGALVNSSTDHLVVIQTSAVA